MSLDQRAKQRFCGYCGNTYEDMNMEEFMCHLHICEEEMVKWKRSKKRKKNR